MAERGNFRTVFNGFHKSDVLEYIDSIQAGYANDLHRYREQIAELHKQLDNAGAEAAQWTARVEEVENELAVLQAKYNQLQQEQQENSRNTADMYRLTQEVEILHLEKKELISRLSESQANSTPAAQWEQQVRLLNEQLTSADADMRTLAEEHSRLTEETSILRRENQTLTSQLQDNRSQLSNAQSQLQDAQAQLRITRESNRQYDSLVGDTGTFIVELYTMGQRFLETAYKRSDGCLSTMETSIATLAAQMEQARQQVKQARQDLMDHGSVAGLRLDELVQSLEQSAGLLENVPVENVSQTKE